MSNSRDSFGDRLRAKLREESNAVETHNAEMEKDNQAVREFVRLRLRQVIREVTNELERNIRGTGAYLRTSKSPFYVTEKKRTISILRPNNQELASVCFIWEGSDASSVCFHFGYHDSLYYQPGQTDEEIIQMIVNRIKSKIL